MFRTSFYLKAASARKEDSIDTVHLSNDSPDDKLSNGASFIAIVILGVIFLKFVLLKGQIWMHGKIGGWLLTTSMI